MSDQIIQYTEEMVGANHPTKADTLNRALLVGHNADGTHKEAFGLSRLQQLIDNLSIAATVGSKALTVAVKGEDGNNCSASNVHTIGFRSATLTDGKPVPRTLQAASSIVLPSGATLGFTANEAGRIYVWEIDNAGTVEPALSRTADIFPESNLVSTTAIGADSDSASVMYSTTARTNVACRCIGYIEITTGATPGEWDNAPTKIQVMGPGVKRTGDVVQSAYISTGTTATLATRITADDSTPQITEGDEVLALSMTPTSALNRLDFVHIGMYAPNAATAMVAALFVAGTANALGVSWAIANAGLVHCIVLKHRQTAGVTTSLAFSIRAGGSGQTIYLNSNSAVGYFGGSLKTMFEITEVFA